MGYYKKLKVMLEEKSDKEAEELCRHMNKEAIMKHVVIPDNDFTLDKWEEERYNIAITANTEALFEMVNGHPRRY